MGTRKPPVAHAFARSPSVRGVGSAILVRGVSRTLLCTSSRAHRQSSVIPPYVLTQVLGALGARLAVQATSLRCARGFGCPPELGCHQSTADQIREAVES